MSEVEGLLASFGSRLETAATSAAEPAPVPPSAGDGDWTPDSGPPRKIDQIAVRRRAGFVFLSPADWRSLTPDEQKALVRTGECTFLSGGAQVGLREAIADLRE